MLPLLGIVPAYDQFNVLLVNEVNQFSCAGTQACFIVIKGRGLTLLRHSIEILRHGDGVYRQEDRPRLWETNKNGLMPRNMPAGFQEFNKQFCNNFPSPASSSRVSVEYGPECASVS